MANLNLSALKNIPTASPVQKTDTTGDSVSPEKTSVSTDVPNIQKISLVKLRKQNGFSTGTTVESEVKKPKEPEIEAQNTTVQEIPNISIHPTILTSDTTKNEEILPQETGEIKEIKENKAQSQIPEESASEELISIITEVEEKSEEVPGKELPKEFFPGLSSIEEFDFDKDLLKLEDDTDIIQNGTSLSGDIRAIEKTDAPDSITDQTLQLEETPIATEKVFPAEEMALKEEKEHDKKPSPEYVKQIKTMLSRARNGWMHLLAKNRKKAVTLGIAGIIGIFGIMTISAWPTHTIPEGKINVSELPPTRIDAERANHELPPPSETTKVPPIPEPKINEQIVSSETPDTNPDYTAGKDYTVIKNTKKNRRHNR